MEELVTLAKPHNLGENFYDYADAFLGTLDDYAYWKTCESLGLDGYEAKNDRESVERFLQRHKLHGKFNATYNSILEKEAERNPIAKAILLRLEKKYNLATLVDTLIDMEDVRGSA